jgi:L-amino acid N-acyltransferase YncA
MSPFTITLEPDSPALRTEVRGCCDARDQNPGRRHIYAAAHTSAGRAVAVARDADGRIVGACASRTCGLGNYTRLVVCQLGSDRSLPGIGRALLRHAAQAAAAAGLPLELVSTVRARGFYARQGMTEQPGPHLLFRFDAGQAARFAAA